MRRFLFSLLVVPLLAAGAARAGDDKKDAPAEGEVRVFVTDSKFVPVGEGGSVTVYLDYGGFKKTLKTELVKPAAAKADPHAGMDKKQEEHKEAESHGGQSMEAEGYTVELAVQAPEAEKAGAKKDEDKDADHEKAPDEPYFKAMAQLVAYQDSMKDADPAEKPGKCAKCGMMLQANPAKFTAVVVVKIGTKTINAKGFVYPEEGPKSLADAAAKIGALLDEIDGLVKAGKLDDVHKSAEKISKAAEHLDELSKALPAADHASATKLGTEIVGLFEEIDKTADAGKADETKKVIAQYRAKLEALKKLVK